MASVAGGGREWREGTYGLYREYRALYGEYIILRLYMGIMEKEMETTRVYG